MSSKFKRSKNGKKHVRIDEWIMRTEAWRSLKPNDVAVYIQLKRKYDGFNNGRIAFPVRAAGEAANLGKNAVSISLNQLCKAGFVRVVTHSGFNRKSRVAAEYRLTEYSNDLNGDLPTKDFVNWEPVEASNEKTTVPIPTPLSTVSGTVEPKKGVKYA